MSVEAPVSLALILRLPDPKISAAAFQIMMGLALWIESPVIDLLSTSTTLAKTRQNYVELSRFVWWLIGIVTVVHALFVFTPIYTLVTERLMGVPTDVAHATRIGLAVMLPWSGFIGWRRYLQGILIRNGQTHLVGIGTAIRVGTVFASGLSLYFLTKLPSIQIAGIALICSVGAEALFAHVASRRTVHACFSRVEAGEPVTMRKLRNFHLPLTATTMLNMISLPIVSAALAQAAHNVEQLAGYQVAFTLVWLMRTTVYAVPEVVITLYKDRQSAAALRRFSIGLGIATSSLLAVIWLTGLDKLFFSGVLGAEGEILEVAHLAFIAPILTPLIGALQSFVRGMLTTHHLTVSRLFAISVSMTVLIVGLVLIVALKASNVVTVGLCLTLAMGAELVVLISSWRAAERRNAYLSGEV